MSTRTLRSWLGQITKIDILGRFGAHELSMRTLEAQESTELWLLSHSFM